VLLVALTGGIGSGKSLAGQFFAELGALVVDSDQLAREVIERGTVGFDEVLTRFGDQILREGNIDRRKLGQLVFNDATARADLEAITHPKIKMAFEEIISKAPENSIVINQIPLLLEINGRSRFDLIIVIVAEAKIRIERLLDRGLKAQEINDRIAVQATDEQRREIADIVILNSDDTENLLRQIEKVWEEELLPRVKAK
jgi:dephospho-CoA kinase